MHFLKSSIAYYWYRMSTAAKAFWKLYFLPQKTIDDFMKSYELYGKDVIEDGDESKLVDYYSVLNELCSIGPVEKMYIPPTINPQEGVFANQVLFEKKMMKDLKIDWKCRVLDMGCGRGRIAAHIASETSASVYGFNVDPNQVANARQFAKMQGLSDKLNFTVSNYNDPFPYSDGFFDAMYHVQAFSYAKDKEEVCAEIFRVLKPGGMVSFLDWVALPKYDHNNAHHVDLLKRVKPLIGAVETPTPEELSSALENVGFKVTFSGDVSVNDHQADLIQKADTFFCVLKGLVNLLVWIRILPRHFKVLFDRFTKDGDAFVEADRLGLFTTSYQTIARKPKL